MEPEAVTENVAVIPEGTVWFWGCVVMVGGVPDMPPQAVKPKESVQPSKSTKNLGWVNASPRAKVLVAQPTKRIHRPAVLTGRRIEQVVGCACFEGKEIFFTVTAILVTSGRCLRIIALRRLRRRLRCFRTDIPQCQTTDVVWRSPQTPAIASRSLDASSEAIHNPVT